MRVLLLALPLMMLGCGPAHTKPSPEDDFTNDTTEAPSEVAWPTRQRSCDDAGNWCGPAGQVQPLAPKDEAGAGDGDDPADACPDTFSREPYSYRLDVEATAGSIGGTCCYAYTDESCRTP